MTVQVHITMTGKGYSPKDEWGCFDEDTKYFENMPIAKAWLKEQYGNASRSPMFVDTKDGTSKQCGYIYGFHNADLSHYPVEKWIQRDWVSFSTVEALDPTIA